MEHPEQYDDCLSVRNGHLFIEDLDTVELVQKYGSPIFVYSETQLRNNIRRFQQSFQQGWPGQVKVMPAAKANWILAIQKIIASEGCGCDIYSRGEFEIALKAGFDPAYISVNGVPKDEQLIKRAIEVGAKITIDSIEELDWIDKYSKELNKKAYVRLRLKPTLYNFHKHSDFSPTGLVPTDIAAVVYKGGLPLDKVIELGKRILKSDNIELTGFHQHHGRHHKSLAYWREQMRSYAKDLGTVCKALGGFQPKEIDIGGGFAARRDPFNAETDYFEPYELLALHIASKILKIFGNRTRYKVLDFIIDKAVLYKPNEKPAPAVEQYAKVCTETLKQELPKYGINPENVMLQLEPGRSLHSDAGIHLTTLRAVKHFRKPIRWTQYIFDTTEFWFTGGRYEHHLHDFIFANKADQKKTKKADIVGRSCYGDRLIPTVKVPENLQVGDILAILDTGAYQEVSMSNFNALPRPATILVKGNQSWIIRQAENLEDVWRRDIIPDHLT